MSLPIYAYISSEFEPAWFAPDRADYCRDCGAKKGIAECVACKEYVCESPDARNHGIGEDSARCLDCGALWCHKCAKRGGLILRRCENCHYDHLERVAAEVAEVAA